MLRNVQNMERNYQRKEKMKGKMKERKMKNES